MVIPIMPLNASNHRPELSSNELPSNKLIVKSRGVATTPLTKFICKGEKWLPARWYNTVATAQKAAANKAASCPVNSPVMSDVKTGSAVAQM
jgi:hypothetical protein